MLSCMSMQEPFFCGFVICVRAPKGGISHLRQSWPTHTETAEAKLANQTREIISH